MTDYDPDANSYGCWALGIKAAREKRIRSGEIEADPSCPEQVRWAGEGEVPPSKLDAVKENG